MVKFNSPQFFLYWGFFGDSFESVLLFILDFPQTHDPPVSTCQGLGLQECITTLGFWELYKDDFNLRKEGKEFRYSFSFNKNKLSENAVEYSFGIL